MEAPSGTVTFLFTDIEGSTRRWEEMPAAMGLALARHDAIVEEAITSHGGVVFSRMGDGMAAAFASARECLEASLEAQRGLAQESWPDEIGELRVRMGAHTGEGVVVNGQYLNQPLNRCARLMAVAHGGQVVISGTTEPLVRGSLPDGVILVDLGEHRLRDLDRPMHIFQLGEGSFAPLRSLDAFPGNLPVQLTSFVGREGDRATLAKALGKARLVTLTGTGGVGKTRLAVQAAADTLLEFPDGAWLCELAAASDPDSMLEVVAISLGSTPRQGVALAQGIGEFLGSKAMLIVLDNCEHVLDAAADLVEKLLATCPRLRILATSREALDVDGERVVRLRSLAVPDPGATLDEILSADAPRLFIDRAEAAGVEVNLSEPNGQAVVEICRRLDGIPLAIELAAARVVALSPVEIAARLDERFRLLTGGRRVSVERHHTLRATVDWSYSLLTPTEQAVFDRLGTFPASFDAAAAEAVAADEGIEGWDVLDALTSLVAKSMLVADQSAEGSTRYQMLESLRHYARERLDATGSADTIRRLHARHYASIASEIAELLRGLDELAGRSRLWVEVDNLRAAVFWGLDATREEDGALALRTIAALVGVGSTWGWVGVGSWAQQALGRAEGEDARYRSLIRGRGVTQRLLPRRLRARPPPRRRSRTPGRGSRLSRAGHGPDPGVHVRTGRGPSRSPHHGAGRAGQGRSHTMGLRVATIGGGVHRCARRQSRPGPSRGRPRPGALPTDGFPNAHLNGSLRLRPGVVADQPPRRVGHTRRGPLHPPQQRDSGQPDTRPRGAAQGQQRGHTAGLRGPPPGDDHRQHRKRPRRVCRHLDPRGPGARVCGGTGGGGGVRRDHHQWPAGGSPAPPTSRDR